MTVADQRKKVLSELKGSFGISVDEASEINKKF